MSIQSVRPSNHLIPCHSLLHLPSVFPASGRNLTHYLSRQCSLIASVASCWHNVSFPACDENCSCLSLWQTLPPWLQHEKNPSWGIFYNVSEQSFSKVSAVLALVSQRCLTLQPHGLQPARLLCPWDSPKISFRGSSQSKDRTQVSRFAGRFFTSWAPRVECTLVQSSSPYRKAWCGPDHSRSDLRTCLLSPGHTFSLFPLFLYLTSLVCPGVY